MTRIDTSNAKFELQINDLELGITEINDNELESISGAGCFGIGYVVNNNKGCFGLAWD